MPCNTCVDPARCEQVCQNLLFTLSRTDHVTSNAFIASACEAAGEVVALVDGPDEDAPTPTGELQKLRAFFREVAELTTRHDVLNDNAVVYPNKLGAALERVDPNWCASACDQSGEVVAMVTGGAPASDPLRRLHAAATAALPQLCDTSAQGLREADELRAAVREAMHALDHAKPDFTPIGRFFLRDGQWVRAAPGSPVGETLYRRTDGVLGTQEPDGEQR